MTGRVEFSKPMDGYEYMMNIESCQYWTRCGTDYPTHLLGEFPSFGYWMEIP